MNNVKEGNSHDGGPYSHGRVTNLNIKLTISRPNTLSQNESNHNGL